VLLALVLHDRDIILILKLFGAFVLGGVVQMPAVGVASREIQSLLPPRSPPGTGSYPYRTASRGRSSGSNGCPGARAWVEFGAVAIYHLDFLTVPI
jgi:hypothetical protein